MKYINTHYSLFDSCDFNRYFANSDKGGGFCGGEGKILIPAATTKLFFAFDLYTQGTSSSSCWPLQIYFSDGEYNTVKLSTVQIQLQGAYSNNTVYLKTNNAERYKTTLASNRWYRIYLAIDTTAGTVDFYVDGNKVGTYDDYVKTGVKAISCKIKLVNAASSLYTKMRNIIISDSYFPVNETIIEIPAIVTANGFIFDSNSGDYSTETENNTLQLEPDLSVLNGYKVTGCNVGMGTTVLGDTIKHIKCDMGAYSNTKEIPATGLGMYFEGLPTSISNITLTAKK